MGDVILKPISQIEIRPATSARELIFARDWSTTELGPASSWPEALTNAIDYIYSAPFACALICGTGLIQICNERFASISGRDLVGPAPAFFAESWESLLPLVKEALDGKLVKVKEFFLAGGINPFVLDMSPVRERTGNASGVMLTLSRARDGEHNASIAPFLSLVARPGRPELLLIDENEESRTHLSDILSPFFNVTREMSPAHALKKLIRSAFDVVVMSESSTEEVSSVVARALRSQCRTKDTPLLLLSDDTDAHRLARKLSEGVTDIAAKHGPREDLFARVEGCLRLSWLAKSMNTEINNFFSSSADYLCILGSDGHFKRLSPSWASLLGYSLDELYKIPLLDLLHPDDAISCGKKSQRLFASPELTAINFVNRVRSKTGEYKFLSWNVTHEDGLIYGSARDVTVEKRFQSQILERETYFRSLVDDSPAMMWTSDATGACTYLSKQWYLFTGRTPNEDLGFGWLGDIHEEDRKNASDTFCGTSRDHKPLSATYRLKHHSGEYRWVLDIGHPRFGAEGEFLGYIGTVIDVHATREAQAVAERANNAKTQFLANMSHEIRTPISAIMGFVDLLKNAEIPHCDRDKFISIVEKNSQQLLTLIDDILDLSKVEAGKVNVKHDTFSLSELLGELASTAKLKASEKGIEFSMTVEKGVPDLVTSDSTRLRQILSNLLGNALKFTEKGSVQLSVAYSASNLTFRVKDTGCGISAEQSRRLFTLFGQAEDSTSKKFGGSGLGLVLSKRLARLLGGDIVLERSTVNDGSIFVATVHVLPATKTAGPEMTARYQPTSTAPAPNQTSSNHRLQGLKVLLVEDSPDNRLLFTAYLKNTGAQVTVAEDGEEGVKRAQARPFDVVLMDIEMPRMNGYDAARKLRSCGYAIPIVALTAHAMSDEKEKCYASGCNDYLTKPVPKDTLVSALSKYLH